MDSDWYNPGILTQLLEIGWRSDHEWSVDELSEILEHQLDAALPAEIYAASRNQSTEHGKSGQPFANQSVTFRDALLSPHTSLTTLRRAKDCFKSLCHGMNHSLPEEISTALYYASLASALVHCKTHISSVDSQSFQNGLAWLSERPWINRDMQKLYLDALAALANRPIP